MGMHIFGSHNYSHFTRCISALPMRLHTVVFFNVWNKFETTLHWCELTLSMHSDHNCETIFTLIQIALCLSVLDMKHSAPNQATTDTFVNALANDSRFTVQSCRDKAKLFARLGNEMFSTLCRTVTSLSNMRQSLVRPAVTLTVTWCDVLVLVPRLSLSARKAKLGSSSLASAASANFLKKYFVHIC